MSASRASWRPLESVVPHADSYRTDTDVECYCSTVTTWPKVKERMQMVADWAGKDGATRGWNNLDSLALGDSRWTGLNVTERETMMNLWAIAAAPLYSGDDLTMLDDDGLRILTNDRLIAVNQDPQASPITVVNTPSNTWAYVRPFSGGRVAVGLFNATDGRAHVTVKASDLGLDGEWTVTDVWTGEQTQEQGEVSRLEAHASTVVVVAPK